jgi:hypothetical protein
MKRFSIIALILLFVSCGTNSEEVNESTNTTVTSTITESSETTINTNDSTTTTVNDVFKYEFDVEKMSPFTGLELTPEIWLKRPRRAIAFKIDNNLNARPQSGLQEADAVYEVLVEGGMTRFLAFFLDKSSTYLGPIRSARPTDPTLVRPFGGTLVVSGATEGLIPAIRDLGVPVLEEQSSPTMFRISSRKAPHNLYADTELVRQRIDDRGFYFLQPGPMPLYPFGLDQTNWNDGAERITIKYSDFTTVIWKNNGESYSRFIIDGYSNTKEAVAHNFVTQDGAYTDILKTETIVIFQGPFYNDKATTLPSILTVGVGDVYVINDGKFIKGTWRRSDITDSFDFVDENQNPIYVPPSTQWVHVMTNEGTVTISDN